MASRGGIYLIRTRKPSAPLGLGLRWWAPITLLVAGALAAVNGPWYLAPLLLTLCGRHNAYVGLTSSYYHRERQHLLGGGVYGARRKDWADLDPRFYRILPLPNWRWLLHVAEGLAIALLCPVYNVQLQPAWNLRKISSRQAERQAWQRARWGTSAAIGRMIGRWLIGMSALGLTAWMFLAATNSI